ncbi:hypothetical protein EVG20_g9782 [Dentipellis fragilis]|uniref:Calcineurin-like phosphoesterase domain-containing protein n=1 Tax=Dentipellis fragilis TaxID=205917 RepID=A0A4Y9XXZ5_9AGAM|nr:hypothetical protein EVG20_g9782 [Dentipellis fragilis]
MNRLSSIGSGISLLTAHPRIVRYEFPQALYPRCAPRRHPGGCVLTEPDLLDRAVYNFTGKFEDIGNVKTYVATPSVDSAVTQPKVEAVIDALKSQGVTRFGAIGYCYGGRLCFNLAFENKVHTVVGNHPLLLELSDIEKYAETASAPLLLNTCEIDPAFPAEKQTKADEVFGNGRYKPGYERTFWPSTAHGFAVRGDLANPQIKEAKEGAFKTGVKCSHSRQKETRSSRIVAVGDLHGDIGNAQKVLEMADVVDAEGNWSGRVDVLVQTGDIIDRGDDTILLFDWMEQLRIQAQAADGLVLSHLGNHEWMNAIGDWR